MTKSYNHNLLGKSNPIFFENKLSKVLYKSSVIGIR